MRFGNVYTDEPPRIATPIPPEIPAGPATSEVIDTPQTFTKKKKRASGPISV